MVKARKTVEIMSNLFHELVRIGVSTVTNFNGNISRILFRKHSASIDRKDTSTKIILFFQSLTIEPGSKCSILTSSLTVMVILDVSLSGNFRQLVDLKGTSTQITLFYTP